MNIQLNGEACQTEAKTLDLLLVQFEYGDAVVATAVNGEFVAEEQRRKIEICDGDAVEILAPMQGG
ncbi:MAG: thiamine biosynthesis protein ThiS [Hyphomicrobiales bacterium]|nr:MAG: thiamine biosynthesis protein ThiS [Hyphomicrobiales bacterium]